MADNKGIKPPETDDPTTVLITPDQPPVAVVVKGGNLPSQKTTTKGKGTTLYPTTTEAQDAVSQGQRYINRLWEHTQAIIAVTVVLSTCFVLSFLTIAAVLYQLEMSSNAVLLVGHLVVMATNIVTSYFTRTNHVRQGGVGEKPDEEIYKGR